MMVRNNSLKGCPTYHYRLHKISSLHTPLWWLNLLHFLVLYRYKICDCIVFVCTRMVRQTSRIFHGGGQGDYHEAVSNLYLILKPAL